jgi:predicted RNA-binding protein with PUA-like domain
MAAKNTAKAPKKAPKKTAAKAPKKTAAPGVPHNAWLIKSEPHVFSIDDLARDGKTAWEGVRNYQARNFMRDEMAEGDLALFYHSSSDPSGVAGIAEVASAAYPDPSQFDPQSDYFDAAATPEEPRWFLVDFKFVERFPAFVPLAALKARSELEGMAVLQKGQRLSIQTVSDAHLKVVLAMGKAKTKLK